MRLIIGLIAAVVILIIVATAEVLAQSQQPITLEEWEERLKIAIEQRDINANAVIANAARLRILERMVAAREAKEKEAAASAKIPAEAGK